MNLLCAAFVLSVWIGFWNEIRWDETRWDETRWDEMRWDEMRWDEMRWDEMRWDDMRWDEIWWDEMRWDEIRCDEMRSDEPAEGGEVERETGNKYKLKNAMTVAMDLILWQYVSGSVTSESCLTFCLQHVT